LAADPPADHAESVLVQVAAVAAARRAGLRPSPAVTLPEPCPVDERPLCPAAASRRLFELLDAHPELVDEWLVIVEAGGFRLTPEVAVALLGRYRTDESRRAGVARSAGPLADWVTDQFPSRLAPRRGAVAVPPPLPADFAAATIAAPEVASAFVADVVADRARVRRDQPLLVRVIAAVDPASLPIHIAALDERAARGGETTPFVLALLDVARTRHALIDDFR
jgi:hypothetical protein